MVLYEKWRPKSLDELVGQDDVVKRLKVLRDMRGQVLWFYGPPGGGKTSAARILARQVADPYDFVSINAQRVTLEMVRDWQVSCRMPPLASWYAGRDAIAGWRLLSSPSHRCCSSLRFPMPACR